MAQFKIIATVDKNLGLTKAGKKPWFIPEDDEKFQELIEQTASPDLTNAVIMDAELIGTETWRSLHAKKQNSVVIVIIDEVDNKKDINKKKALSTKKVLRKLPKGTIQFDSLQDALDELGNRNDLDEIFVIGGEKLFTEAILHPDLDEIYLTHVEDDYDCDSFFPKNIPEEFQTVSVSDVMESDGIEYSFVILGRSDNEGDSSYECEHDCDDGCSSECHCGCETP